MLALRQVWAVIWRQRWTAGVVAFLGTALVLVGLILAPKSYQAEETVAVIKDPRSTEDVSQLDAARRALARTAISSAVLERARAISAVERTPDQLAEAVSAEAPPGLPTVVIKVRDHDRETAAILAHGVARALVERDPGNPTYRVSIVSPAGVPRMFSTPSVAPILLAGLASTILLAALVAMARDRRMAAMGSTMDIEDAAAAPLLGRIQAPADLGFMPAMRPGTEAAVEFSDLCTSLRPEHSASACTRIVISGVQVGEADVWVGANLAITFASSGQRVLLVDGRLYRSSDPEHVEPPGLAEVIGGAAWAPVVRAGPVEALDVLASGTWPAEESVDEFARGSLEVLDRHSSSYDVVVVLSPEIAARPAAPSAVAQTRVCVVIPPRELPVEVLRSHAARLRNAGGRLAGLLIVDRGRATPGQPGEL